MHEGPPDGGQNCTPHWWQQQRQEQETSHGGGGHFVRMGDVRALSSSSSSSPKNKEFDGGSTIHVATSLDGPWSPLANDLGGCNNPAPWVHPNGTIYIGCAA